MPASRIVSEVIHSRRLVGLRVSGLQVAPPKWNLAQNATLPKASPSTPASLIYDPLWTRCDGGGHLHPQEGGPRLLRR
jgi:hypothetical protein